MSQEEAVPRVTTAARRGSVARNMVVAMMAFVGSYLLRMVRSGWDPMHAWNRAFGDISFLLLAMTMATGPLARLWPAAGRFLPWRREMGIWTVVFAVAHTYVVLSGWVRWDLPQLLGLVPHPDLNRYVMLQHGFGLSNIVGILALAYGFVLGLSSNTVSQRLLGGSAWKFLQQGSYVLWALVVVHTAYFLFIHFRSFHRPLPPSNWFRLPFVLLVTLVLALQTAAFVVTWRHQHRDKRASAWQPGATSS